MSHQRPYDAIYLSPHLDDAALSCGGRIAQATAAGQTVLVLTVFTGDEPAGPLSALAARLHELWGMARGVPQARRAEDQAACQVLGAEVRHWDLRECIYRSDAHGNPLYTTFDHIFGAVHPADPAAREIGARLAQLPPSQRVYAPLTVGHHVDHQLVRQAAELTFPHGLHYYEDFPYVRKWFALRKVLGPRHRRQAGWQSETVRLSPRDLATKCASVAAYRSQIPTLFHTPQRMERQIRGYARRVGGERTWSRRYPEGSEHGK